MGYYSLLLNGSFKIYIYMHIIHLQTFTYQKSLIKTSLISMSAVIDALAISKLI